MGFVQVPRGANRATLSIGPTFGGGGGSSVVRVPEQDSRAPTERIDDLPYFRGASETGKSGKLIEHSRSSRMF